MAIRESLRFVVAIGQGVDLIISSMRAWQSEIKRWGCRSTTLSMSAPGNILESSARAGATLSKTSLTRRSGLHTSNPVKTLTDD
jgi:hypothetical protein